MLTEKTKVVNFNGLELTIAPIFRRPFKSTGDRLLREVKKLILAEPLRINMSVPAIIETDGDMEYDGKPASEWGYEQKEIEEFPSCGTVGCLAGWTDVAKLGGVLIEEGKRTWSDVEDRAMLHLGLSRQEAESLFHVYNWPEPFRSDYQRAENNDDAIGKAEITAARIDSFIKTRE